VDDLRDVVVTIRKVLPPAVVSLRVKDDYDTVLATAGPQLSAQQ